MAGRPPRGWPGLGDYFWFVLKTILQLLLGGGEEVSYFILFARELMCTGPTLRTLLDKIMRYEVYKGLQKPGATTVHHREWLQRSTSAGVWKSQSSAKLTSRQNSYCQGMSIRVEEKCLRKLREGTSQSIVSESSVLTAEGTAVRWDCLGECYSAWQSLTHESLLIIFIL